MTHVQEQLFTLRDMEYRSFHIRLIPTVDPHTVIGIRVPALRQLAKELRNTDRADHFRATLPHDFYEENMLHAILIESINDFDACITALERFLPHVNNWAVCDSMSPKILGKHRDRLLPILCGWMDSPHPYTVRFAIKQLMTWFLDESFSPDLPARVAAIHSDEYYVNMMVAWYFATALAKQWDTVIPYLTEHSLSPWIHQKTIRKALESYRISSEQKAFLRTI